MDAQTRKQIVLGTRPNEIKITKATRVQPLEPEREPARTAQTAEGAEVRLRRTARHDRTLKNLFELYLCN